MGLAYESNLSLRLELFSSESNLRLLSVNSSSLQKHNCTLASVRHGSSAINLRIELVFHDRILFQVEAHLCFLFLLSNIMVFFLTYIRFSLVAFRTYLICMSMAGVRFK